ncbi:cancer/testis antigen 47A-like isoform X1 [Bubalus kerabau]|uniref:cancer/testis antigen 47A-like isoform X1 n=1 Tax=Bubalus carabanensis TaxID=3119969 RepID=UPI00244E8253|nr:cancer/testis antigen 47A-like isoform X1 [Bubalus carabanensis]
MSTTGDGDLAPGGQEGPAGAAGAQAGARDGVDRNSEARRGDSMPEAEAGRVVGASGGPREAALEGGNAEEDADLRPAEEREVEEQAEGVNRMVVSRHFPMNAFLLTALNLLQSMVNRFSENHVILPANDDRVLVWHQTRPRLSDHGSAAVAGFSEVQVPSDESGEGPAEEAPDQGAEQAEEAQEAEQAEEAQEAEEAEEASLLETATKESEEPSSREMPQEPVAPEKTAECQDENSKEEAQGSKSEGKEKKYKRKQEEPEKDLDPAKDWPRKPRYLCIALKITQLFPGIYQFCFCFLILGVN